MPFCASNPYSGETDAQANGFAVGNSGGLRRFDRLQEGGH
jgi:hypothetical protein